MVNFIRKSQEIYKIRTRRYYRIRVHTCFLTRPDTSNKTHMSFFLGCLPSFSAFEREEEREKNGEFWISTFDSILDLNI